MVGLVELLLNQLLLVSLVGAVLALLTVALVLWSKQVWHDPKKKAEEDKALLKELLEGFGLEIPAELQDQEATVIKSIKSP